MWRNPWYMGSAEAGRRVVAWLEAAAPIAGRYADRTTAQAREIAPQLEDSWRRATRWWRDWLRRGVRKAPVYGAAALALPLLVMLCWYGAEHTDWRWLGHAAMVVAVALHLLTAAAAVVGIGLAAAALVRRERFPFLPLITAAANLLPAAMFLR